MNPMIKPNHLANLLRGSTLSWLPFMAALSTSASASILSDAKITTTLPLMENTKLEFLTDGKMDTYFQSKRNIKAGDSIQLSFTNALPSGKTLRIHTGTTPSDDFFNFAVMESSTDGQSWSVLAEERGAVISGKIPDNTHYIRLRAGRDFSANVAIREVEITDTPSPVIIKKGTATYQGKKYTLSIASNLEGHEDLKPQFEEMAEIYFDIWPKIVEMLGSPVDKTYLDVDIHYKAGIKYPAYADKNYIVISSDHLRKNKEDTIGVFIHELTHVIQQYPTYIPAWFVEGTADYTRYKLNPTDAWGKRHAAKINLDKPLGFYWDSAAFLFYLEETYKKEIMHPVSIAVRNNTYQESIWKGLTGKDLAQLTKDYKASGWKIKATKAK